jgi:hypothetical protein
MEMLSTLVWKMVWTWDWKSVSTGDALSLLEMVRMTDEMMGIQMVTALENALCRLATDYYRRHCTR